MKVELSSKKFLVSEVKALIPVRICFWIWKSIHYLELTFAIPRRLSGAQDIFTVPGDRPQL